MTGSRKLEQTGERYDIKRLILLGAGGYGQTLADIARQSGLFEQILFLDDQASGPDVLGKCEEYASFASPVTQMLPAFGNNELRIAWLDRLEKAGISVPQLIHASAYVSPTAEIGRGTVVLPLAQVGTHCRIGRGCIINGGAIVDHGCVLEEGVHVCLGAIVKAENHIPRCLKIEAGDVVENRKYPIS